MDSLPCFFIRSSEARRVRRSLIQHEMQSRMGLEFDSPPSRFQTLIGGHLTAETASGLLDGGVPADAGFTGEASMVFGQRLEASPRHPLVSAVQKMTPCNTAK